MPGAAGAGHPAHAHRRPSGRRARPHRTASAAASALSEPHFRRATPADLDLLVPFVRQLYAHDHIDFDAARVRGALSGLIEHERFGWAWVIEDPNLVGYMLVTIGYSIEFGGRDAFLDELFVSPEARGRGLGTRALHVAAEACRAAGIVALHLEVDRGNTAAQRLYRRHGFVDHDRYLMTRRFSGQSAP